ncbi:hypothetical protein A9Q81_18050 [Gammaproteobacteria bacterium 42_54_T18]|nr:hypothetical protein A9Q81_18050 [Gammaproteobacteria bacterium 42_54_T18]
MNFLIKALRPINVLLPKKALLASTTVAMLTALLVSPLALADNRTRSVAPEAEMQALTDAWQLLDCGERYKQVWFGGQEVRGAGKTYKELIESYDQVPNGADCTVVDDQGAALTHAGYLDAAPQAFKALLESGLTDNHLQSAQWGLQESFNYLAEGKLLKGNDLLINGLRTRFTADDSDTKSQIELLGESVDEMSAGLDATRHLMLDFYDVLRANGDVSPTFPFLVNNTKGPVTANDYQQYAELLNRYGMAAISEAKYMFYKDNVKDVDNPPYRNFPGPEDLDFNNDKVKNEAGRLDAAKRAKLASSHLYLQSLTMAALQTEDNFQDNNGYQIKRQLNDADRLYQDIQSGFNPLLLAGDFVPYQRVENFLQLARVRVQDAKEAEQLARTNQRTFEVDQTALASELLSQRNQYLDQLAALSGAPKGDYDLSTKDGRHDYRVEAFNSAIFDKEGQIGIQVLALEESGLQLTQLYTQMQVLNERVSIEQDRSNEVMKLVLATGEEMSVLQFANTMASCCNVSQGTSTGASKGTSVGSSEGESSGLSTGISFSIGGGFTETEKISWTLGRSLGISRGESSGSSTGTSEGQSWGSSTGTSENPNIEMLADGQSAMAVLQATQQAELDAINSGAMVKNLLLEMATLNVSIEQARIAKARQEAVIETQFDELDRLLANYVIANENLAAAYYSNPAYRLEASRAEQAAEDTFATALELSYYAAKALEYQWSEKFNNPVLRLDGGLPEPLSVSFDPFMRAESVFAAQFAALYSPSLDDYLDGMQAWDVKMRQLRYPERQTSQVRFSLRDDLLGYGEFTAEVAEAKFRSFIEDHRIQGENLDNRDLQFDFSMDIADERLFPNHPNIKIDSIKVNLISTASRSIRGNATVVPALVDLVMLDRAFVRTFFAEYPNRDDMLTYQLQAGRTIDKSPFIATVDATIDGFSSPQVEPNTQLANHSPAVSAWVLRMRNNRFNNTDLKLEYLSDIELEIKYSFGKPRDIQFYN